MSASIARALLDTDILSAIMRRDPAALSRASAYLAIHEQFSFSIITRYEILRGLFAKDAAKQLSAFEHLCDVSAVLPISDAIVTRAAGLYADLYKRGTLIGDADILIAATAIEHNLMVITNNESHFGRIAGLQVDNWLH